jgi:hypothetical protein
MADACSRLLESEWAKSWWLEPAIATLSFAFWMNLFRASEGPTRSLAARIITLPPSELTVSIASSLVAYWVGIMGWVQLVSPPSGIQAGCPKDAASLVQLLAETWCGIVGYDFLFYWVHLSMHVWPSIGRLMGHWRHHDHDGHAGAEPAAETAMRTLHQSALDGTMQVLVSIVVQRHTAWGTPKVRLARWLHNVVVPGLLTESHSAGTLYIARRLSIFGGVRDHYLHHRNRGPPFQQFFHYLDKTISHQAFPQQASRGRATCGAQQRRSVTLSANPGGG